MKEISIKEYAIAYGVTEHNVHVRINKFLKTKTPVNNITGVRKLSAKCIYISVDETIVFSKKF